MLVACRHAGRSTLNSKAYYGCGASARNSRSGRERGLGIAQCQVQRHAHIDLGERLASPIRLVNRAKEPYRRGLIVIG